MCGGKKCKAVGWKQCPTCRNIMRSVCSKAGCRVGGRKPEMILPAASAMQKKVAKSLFQESHDSEYDEDISSEESDNNTTMETEDEDEPEDPLKLSKEKLLTAWKSINPPVKEDDIVGKWYGVIYETKRSSRLFVAKVVRRFLSDHSGPAESLEMRCLKPRVGSETILEDTPAHLADLSVFSIQDIICGPLNVMPLKGAKFDVPDLNDLVEHYKLVAKLNRQEIWLTNRLSYMHFFQHLLC